MPLCALCKLEFNCRVSSMGMEVSASYNNKKHVFNPIIFSLTHLLSYTEETSLCDNKTKSQSSRSIITFLSTLFLSDDLDLMPNKVI